MTSADQRRAIVLPPLDAQPRFGRVSALPPGQAVAWVVGMSRLFERSPFQAAPARPRARGVGGQPLYLKTAWVLLLLLALFPVLASLLDLANVAANGIPSDHRAAFAAVSGLDWSPARAAAAGITRYVSLLETGYALHELVFGLLFLLIVAIPFRRGETWAWLGCWLVLIADLGYTFTFGRHDQAILRNSLIADVALPILLLVQAPASSGGQLGAHLGARMGERVRAGAERAGGVLVLLGLAFALLRLTGHSI